MPDTLTRAAVRSSTPTFIAWKEWYSVGNDELDHHHQTLFSMVNELYAAIQDNTAPEVVGGMLDRMFEYTEWHFACEEERMEQNQYPDIENHKAAHRRLIQDLNSLRLQSLGPDALTGSDMLRFLKRWWVDHIRGTDKEYSPYVSSLPVK